MRTRIILAALMWLLTPALISPTLAFGASSSLAQYLRGSWQGYSGIALNLNGDGKEDLVIGAPYARREGATGALIVYPAIHSRFPHRPSAILDGECNLGWSLVSLGDINGDGKADFATGALNGSNEEVSLAGTVAIYHGSEQPQKVAVLAGENALDKFGFALASGDLNGDGIPDLIVGAPYHSPSPDLYQKGTVYVYFGPGYNPATAVKIPATAAYGGIGFSLATGDINGDGVTDLLLQASGKVIGFYGVKGSFAPDPAAPDVVFTSKEAGFGKSMAVLGDLDGDGFRDVAVGADLAALGDAIDSGCLFLLKGGSGPRTVNADAVSPDRLARIDGEPNCGRFASVILPLGDIDGDGIPDLAVSAVHGDGDPWPMTGKIFLFSGSTLTNGATVASARVILGDARDMKLGSFLALVAQGKKLAAGAPTENANAGTVRFFDLP